MPQNTSVDTVQSQALLQANVCPLPAARVLGLLFAERDIELIEHLKSTNDLPNAEDFPSAEVLTKVLAVEPRWAVFTLNKAQRFLHKRKMNGDYSSDIRAFTQRPDVAALIPACRKLRKGTTVFIGDSLMDIRHFGANASFPILAGAFLESLDVGAYFNAGIGGETTAHGLARFQKDVLDRTPVRVVFSFGSNDFVNGVPIDRICANFDSLIRQSQSVGADVLLGFILPVITDRLWWFPGSMNYVSIEARRPLQSALAEFARSHGISCLDLLDRLTSDHYCVDGIHLNQSGQELCALETLHCLTQSVT